MRHKTWRRNDLERIGKVAGLAVLLPLLAVLLSGCVFAEMQAELQEKISATPVPIDLQSLNYFADIDDAVLSNDFREDINATNKANITRIKLFLGEDEASLAFRNHYNGNDWLCFYKFALEREGDTLLFSQPTYGSGISWKAHVNFEREKAKRTKIIGLGEITSGMAFYSAEQTFNVYPDATFWWGVSQSDIIYQLEVDGQQATEIIPIQMDGQDAYFWYITYPKPNVNVADVVLTLDGMVITDAFGNVEVEVVH